MKEIFIRSLSYYIPEGRVDNDQVLKAMREFNKDWMTQDQYETIYKNTTVVFDFLGIKTRSICKDKDKESSVAITTKVCKDALDKAGIPPNDIDCLIMGGITNPFFEPSFANVVAYEIGMIHGDFFDINDTCNAFLKGMELAKLYINSGKYKNVLVATCENHGEFDDVGYGHGEDGRLENINDLQYKTSMLLGGSGAGAILLSSSGVGAKLLRMAEFRETESWYATLITFPFLRVPPSVYGKRVKGVWSDARKSSSYILKNMPIFAKKVFEEWNLQIEDIDCVISHQLGNNITYGVLNQLNIDSSKAKVNTFSETGNMGSANMPVNLGIAIEKGLVKSGDRVVIFSYGGGMTLMIAEIML